MKKIISILVVVMAGINIYIANQDMMVMSGSQLENVELLAYGEQIVGEGGGYGCGPETVYMWISEQDMDLNCQKPIKFKTCAPGCPKETGLPQGKMTC